ncbi:hypothetical protein Dda_1513 [Drechslerella dactyloides]|uniref:Uncharacterized protein n=1 Tax=Drechslerella dactyloides TaxID=74499 RepID=A0AAD6J261_DREDA|nr:hypothetical protein Dda_1513 [Drechslerella dactyloides]
MGFLDRLFLRQKERKAQRRERKTVKQQVPDIPSTRNEFQAIPTAIRKDADEKPKQALPVQQFEGHASPMSKSEHPSHTEEPGISVIPANQSPLAKRSHSTPAQKKPVAKIPHDGGATSGVSDANSRKKPAATALASKRQQQKTMKPGRRGPGEIRNQCQQQDVVLLSMLPYFEDTDCGGDNPGRDTQTSGDFKGATKLEPSSCGGNASGDKSSPCGSSNSETAATTTSSSAPSAAPDTGDSQTWHLSTHATGYPAYSSSGTDQSTSHSHSHSSGCGGHSSYSSGGDGGFSGGSYDSSF